MLKSIIFDLDGVIIDSEPQHARAATEVLSAYGLNRESKDLFPYIGSSTKHMVEDIIEKENLSVSADDLLEKINAKKRALVRAEGYVIVPGVVEVLEKCHHAGIRLAIASSSSPTEIEQALKALNIRKYFDKCVSSAHVKNPKPAPDSFLLALKELGENAEETIVVEDTLYGCQAAKAAGIVCVGYVNPNSGKQDLSGADVLLESFEDIDERFFIHVLQRSLGVPVVIADTKRLIIRELATEDIKTMYSIYEDPQVRQFIPEIDEYLESEVEKHAAYIRDVYSFYGYGIWGVFSKTSGQLIGRCGLENRTIDGKNEIMLSYLLDSRHWGYGYAIECGNAVFAYAKSQLDIKRIVAVIDRQNLRSLRTAANLNMTCEKEITYRGRDCNLYAISL